MSTIQVHLSLSVDVPENLSEEQMIDFIKELWESGEGISNELGAASCTILDVVE